MQIKLSSVFHAILTLSSQIGALARQRKLVRVYTRKREGSRLARVHQHLHALDQVESVEFKQYLEKLCCDLSEMTSNEGLGRVFQIEGTELNIPTVTAIPLGFIANELITNSIKYGKGKISVRLQSKGGSLNALSISDEGPGLPEDFNPAAAKGIGMKPVLALVRQISGELQISRGENDQGTRFTVLFT